MVFVVSRVQKLKPFFRPSRSLACIRPSECHLTIKLQRTQYKARPLRDIQIQLESLFAMAQEIDTCFVCRLRFFREKTSVDAAQGFRRRLGSNFGSLISRWLFYCFFRVSRISAAADETAAHSTCIPSRFHVCTSDDARMINLSNAMRCLHKRRGINLQIFMRKMWRIKQARSVWEVEMASEWTLN